MPKVDRSQLGIDRAELYRRKIRAVIPDSRDHVAAQWTRWTPTGLDANAYRGRNVIERSFALANQWRGVATRFDTLPITDRASVTLCTALTWTRLLGDTA